MKLIQPYPDHSCNLHVPEEDKVDAGVQVYYVRYRYPHHSLSSGFDRLCDYTGETIKLPYPLYIAGETILRIPGIIMARTGGHYEYSRYDYVMELAVIAHFKKHRNSVYHFVYGEKSFRMLARHAGKNNNRIVLTVHHPPEHSKWLFKSMEHFKCVDHVTVVSRNMIDFWEGVAGKGKVSYVPYAVDTNYFCVAENKPSDRPPRCLFIGYHERDFENLPALAGNLIKGNPELEFLMISPDKRCAAVAELDKRVIWRNRVTDAEYLDLMQNSDLLVLPLRKSTTVTTVLEAMACGMPVITNRGGIEDYLHEDSSMLFDVGDTDGMSDCILSLLSSNKELRKMSESARQHAMCFSWKATALQVCELYKKLF